MQAFEAAQTLAIQSAELLVHGVGDQHLIVAGMLEQPGRHVDGVAETVAGHIDDLAVGQGHTQFQGGRARVGIARWPISSCGFSPV